MIKVRPATYTHCPSCGVKFDIPVFIHAWAKLTHQPGDCVVWCVPNE